MSILALLLSLFRSSPPLAPPVCSKVGVTASELADIINRDLQVPREHIHLSDAVYDLYPRSELDRFIAADRGYLRQYVKEVADCDEFAAVLFGEESVWQWTQDPARKGSTAFGVLWGHIAKWGPTGVDHALNWWLNPDDMKIYLVEPQDRPPSVSPVPQGTVGWVAFS